MTLIAHYEAAIDRGEIIDDPSQRAILVRMEHFLESLKHSKTSWFPWKKAKAVNGIYLYGSVGVGKTYLVDLLYQYISEKKARFHFHHFMQQVDAQLRQLQGQKDPLRQVAKNIAASARVLCFDEFLVDDVAYAMILAALLQALTLEGVIFIISSNTKPDDLYLNGVQRARFLPAIALLNQHCEVLLLQEQRDYRLGREPLLDAYLYPLNEKTEQAMEQQFLSLANVVEKQGSIIIQNRPITYYQWSDRSIWFAFDVLCNFPRSQLDYLEIADRFDNVFISGVPCLTSNHTAQTIMLINLIDVMYDRGINIIISAAVSLDELYEGGEMQEPFKRTLSRLKEMQSADYLSRHPRRITKNLV